MEYKTKTVIVASGGTTSTVVQLEMYDMVGLQVPTLTSTTLKIQVGDDGTNWFDVYNGDGTQVLNWTASTGARALSTRDLADIIGYRLARIVLGTAQADERTFTWTFKIPLR